MVYLDEISDEEAEEKMNTTQESEPASNHRQLTGCDTNTDLLNVLLVDVSRPHETQHVHDEDRDDGRQDSRVCAYESAEVVEDALEVYGVDLRHGEAARVRLHVTAHLQAFAREGGERRR